MNTEIEKTISKCKMIGLDYRIVAPNAILVIGDNSRSEFVHISKDGMKTSIGEGYIDVEVKQNENNTYVVMCKTEENITNLGSQDLARHPWAKFDLHDVYSFSSGRGVQIAKDVIRLSIGETNSFALHYDKTKNNARMKDNMVGGVIDTRTGKSLFGWQVHAFGYSEITNLEDIAPELLSSLGLEEYGADLDFEEIEELEPYEDCIEIIEENIDMCMDSYGRSEIKYFDEPIAELCILKNEKRKAIRILISVYDRVIHDSNHKLRQYLYGPLLIDETGRLRLLGYSNGTIKWDVK